MFLRGIISFVLFSSVFGDNCAHGTGSDGNCVGWQNYSIATEAAKFCQPGYFGKDCFNKCGLNKCALDDDDKLYCSVDGNCTHYDLYKGDTAAKHCQDGYFGDDCYRKCGLNKCSSVSCSADGNCPSYSSFNPPDAALFCQPGYFGKDCYSGCRLNKCNSTYCSVDGNCPNYNQYTTGDDPADLCQDGWYGKNCYAKCSLNQCSSGKCSFDGNCPYYTQYASDMPAKLCQKGYYGEDCYRSCKLNRCAYGMCSFDGNCPGYSRTNWDLCQANNYGKDCYNKDSGGKGCALDIRGDCTTGPVSTIKGVLVSESGYHAIGGAKVELQNIFDRANITNTTTASDGTFLFTVDAGSWFLTAYVPNSNISVSQDVFMENSVNIGTLKVPTTSTVTISGSIKDAVNGFPISGATVSTGDYTNVSSTDGSYSVLAIPGLVALNISKDGYLIDAVRINATEDTRADEFVSPKLAQAQFRVVLSWGASPLDLDLHMHGYSNSQKQICSVSYSHKNCTFPPSQVRASLDIDARRGFGPETITLNAKAPVAGQSFRIVVVNYSQSPSIMLSDAKVVVYNEKGVMGRFSVSESKDKRDPELWEVAELVLEADGSAKIFTL